MGGRGYKLLDDKQVEWAYEKWCIGYTQEQIADALYCHRKTVNRALHGKPRIRPILVYEGGFGNE